VTPETQAAAAARDGFVAAAPAAAISTSR